MSTLQVNQLTTESLNIAGPMVVSGNTTITNLTVTGNVTSNISVVGNVNASGYTSNGTSFRGYTEYDKGTYFKLIKIGSNTVTTLGTWTT